MAYEYYASVKCSSGVKTLEQPLSKGYALYYRIYTFIDDCTPFLPKSCGSKVYLVVNDMIFPAELNGKRKFMPHEP
mgnify:FL=1